MAVSSNLRDLFPFFLLFSFCEIKNPATGANSTNPTRSTLQQKRSTTPVHDADAADGISITYLKFPAYNLDN